MQESKNINTLLEKYHKGLCSSEEKEIVERFFDKLQENGVTPEAIKTDLYLKNKIFKNINDQIQPRKKRWIPTSVAAVAIVLLATSLFTLFFNPFGSAASYEIAEASYGQQLRVVLSDSSIVHLNSGSSLTYPKSFDDLSERNITLEGEAFFEVTKNKEKPFIVSSGEINTKVLGTKFTVNNFDKNKPSVVVTEGKVNVSSRSNSEISVDILPDERVAFESSQNNFTKTKVNSQNYAAWIDGTVVFNEANVEEMAEILRRRFNVDVEVTAKIGLECRISGKYSGNSLTELLKSIRFINGVNYEYDGNTIILSGVACESIP